MSQSLLKKGGRANEGPLSGHRIIVRDLKRDDDGHWTADVAAVPFDEKHDGTLTFVHRTFGSWMVGFHPTMKDVHPEVAAVLQEKVIQLERKERKQ